MIDLESLCATLGADRAEVRGWIIAGYVRAAGEPDHWIFAEADVARVRLIRELKYEMAVHEENLDIVLGLLDQVYGLRRELTALARAVEGQPDAIRAAIVEALRK